MAPLTYPRPLVLTGLLLSCTILALYVGLQLRISIVYTHLFYIPIVLGGLWYPRKSLLPALYLGILHLGVEYASFGGLEFSVVARAGSFLLVGGLVGLIAGRIQRGDRASLQYMSSYAERVSTPRTKILSSFDGIRMSLGMNMDVERMREQGDTGALLLALDHPRTEVRYQVVDALGTLRDPVAGERLAQALRDPDCGVRWKAAEALGKLGPAALPHLLDALHDSSSDIRWRAALALGDTGQKEAIPALVGALADPDPYVRGRAVVALSGFGEAAIPLLTRAVREGENRVGQAAVRALGLLGEPGLSLLDQILKDHPADEGVLSSFEEAFLDQGGQSVPVVMGLLESPEDPHVRALACRVLGRLRDARALEPLVRTRYSDTDEGVRNAAETAIRRLMRSRHGHPK
jgi:HEAT repeat protein